MTNEPENSNSTPGDPFSGLSLGKHKAPPANVPVFNCIVYVSPAPQGGVTGRVGNLAGFEAQAGSERELLGKIVAAFKQHVKQTTEQGEAIEWIDPPHPPQPNEQTRFIPVHL